MACGKSGNIILIGMPSSGKSTVGVLLAKTLGKAFVDTDLLIQQREGKKLQEIINEKGNDYFHKVEEEVLLGVDAENTVIATGGSAVYFPDALDRFRKNGTVVYLDISLESVLERLRNIKTRGVTLEKGQTLENLYNVRTPLYEARCDVRIKADGGTAEEVIERIIEAVYQPHCILKGRD